MTTSECDTQRPLDLCVLLLLCDFEDDIDRIGTPRGRLATPNRPNRCFFDAKDISKQVRDSVRDLGLIEEIPGGCYEHSEPDDASHSVE